MYTTKVLAHAIRRGNVIVHKGARYSVGSQPTWASDPKTKQYTKCNVDGKWFGFNEPVEIAIGASTK